MKDFETYLKELDIPEDDKKYASSFFKKEEYLKSIYSIAINVSKSKVYSGKGNPNSKIMICIDIPEHETIIRKFLTPLLDRVNISIWNCYLTFIRKTDIESINKQVLISELSCIKPAKVLEFNIDPTNLNEVQENNYSKITIAIKDVEYVLDKNHFKDEFYTDFMNNVCKYIMTLIPIKEIEISK